MVGLEGDTIQIKKGVVFLNGKNFDQDLNLCHFYKTSKENLQKIRKLDFDVSNVIVEAIDPENVKLLLEDNFAKKMNFEIVRYIDDTNFVDQEIEIIYNKPWNKDNFGPVKIGKSKVFVLGDNRDYTIDSRTIGLINVDEIVGVIIKIL